MKPLSVDPHKLEELLTYCLNFAKQMLGSHGEFHPFGAAIDSSGVFKAIGAWNGEEHPKGQDMAKLLITGFRKDFPDGNISAAALAANVNIPSEFKPFYPDGIRVTLECEAYARNIYLPYRIKKKGLLDRIRSKDSSIDYADLFAVEITPSLRVT
jgi:hypothetical protein